MTSVIEVVVKTCIGKCLIYASAGWVFWYFDYIDEDRIDTVYKLNLANGDEYKCVSGLCELLPPHNISPYRTDLVSIENSMLGEKEVLVVKERVDVQNGFGNLGNRVIELESMYGDIKGLTSIVPKEYISRIVYIGKGFNEYSSFCLQKYEVTDSIPFMMHEVESVNYYDTIPDRLSAILGHSK